MFQSPSNHVREEHKPVLTFSLRDNDSYLNLLPMKAQVSIQVPIDLSNIAKNYE